MISSVAHIKRPCLNINRSCGLTQLASSCDCVKGYIYWLSPSVSITVVTQERQFLLLLKQCFIEGVKITLWPKIDWLHLVLTSISGDLISQTDRSRDVYTWYHASPLTSCDITSHYINILSDTVYLSFKSSHKCDVSPSECGLSEKSLNVFDPVLNTNHLIWISVPGVNGYIHFSLFTGMTIVHSKQES